MWEIIFTMEMCFVCVCVFNGRFSYAQFSALANRCALELLHTRTHCEEMEVLKLLFKHFQFWSVFGSRCKSIVENHRRPAWVLDITSVGFMLVFLDFQPFTLHMTSVSQKSTFPTEISTPARCLSTMSAMV